MHSVGIKLRMSAAVRFCSYPSVIGLCSSQLIKSVRRGQCTLCILPAGRFRHLPVIEDGEVVALLDITKCLYDAIARMEKAMEKGHAIAAAMEGMGNAQSEWGGASGRHKAACLRLSC